MFTPMPNQVDLPALEHDVLRRWRESKVFERSLAATQGRPQWTFYEGPPTANGMPGTHHVEARVFKDLFPRFKTMKGYHVPRKAGWDCHGLPVELDVEKELGFNGKRTSRRTASPSSTQNAGRRSSGTSTRSNSSLQRMGYWVDMSQAYRTMDASYIESVWWSLKIDLRQGPARSGLPRRALLPAVWHGAVRSRGRTGLSERHRPERLRALPGHLRSVRRPGRPAGLDDDTVDARQQHRGRGTSRRPVRHRQSVCDRRRARRDDW